MNHPRSVHELLEHFTSDQLADALARADERTSGTKDDRADRLVLIAQRKSWSLVALLDHFDAEALRGVCAALGHRAARKADMTAWLGALIGESVPRPSSPDLAAATVEDVRKLLAALALTDFTVRDERDAAADIGEHLRRTFRDIHEQFHVGGYFGHTIDFDLGDGSVGLEIKLASSVLGGSSEAYRLLGQCLYYDRRRYRGCLVVAIVGSPSQRASAPFAELESILSSQGVSVVFVASA